MHDDAVGRLIVPLVYLSLLLCALLFIIKEPVGGGTAVYL
jgi:lipopolysaccharide export LptBFGC system permease protein LptF